MIINRGDIYIPVKNNKMEILLKISNKEKLTPDEFMVASELGIKLSETQICDPNTLEVQPGQMLHIILRDELHTPYQSGLCEVIEVFDQMVVVYVPIVRRRVSVPHDQIMAEYEKKSDVECMPLTKNGSPVFIEKEEETVEDYTVPIVSVEEPSLFKFWSAVLVVSLISAIAATLLTNAMIQV